MKENVTVDFEKYGETIRGQYQRYYGKRLGLSIILLGVVFATVLLVPLTILKVMIFILATPVVVILLSRNYQAYQSKELFIAKVEADWLEKINQIDWQNGTHLIYEDSDNYYLKKEDTVQRFLKKGSRTLPSANRGLSLIVAENSDLFTKDTPLLVEYCDITEIKFFNLAQTNEKILRQMKLTQLKNKIMPPLFIGIVIIFILLYLF